ncbi:MAG: adenine deaminase [Syntrophaceae bacterium]|nr:adenine deaminase [Syntrophaceae bacterium]
MNSLEELIDVAKGVVPADLLLKNGRIANVLTGEVYPAHVAIAGEWIAGVGAEYTEGKEVLDLSGLVLCPGLINGHLHLESSLLTPAEYARLAVAHGTTSVVLDPHEIANVLGTSGIQTLMEASENLPLDFFFMAPSCVPATPLETSGASLSSKEVQKLLGQERVLGLGEMMNFPGVLGKDPEVSKKIEAARKAGKPVDGHAPLLSGKNLNAYVAAGIESDHECTRREEAEEKLRLGMWLMIREGTAAKNLKNLLPAVTPQNSRRCLLVLDDLEAGDLLQNGELDHALRQAVSLGLDPLAALQMATINPSERFGLKDRGSIAPGKRADLTAVRSLENFRSVLTFKNGKVAAREGKAYPLLHADFSPQVLHSVKIEPLESTSFSISLKGDRAWVMGIVPDQIVTRKLSLTIKKDERGFVLSDPDGDILKLAVIERHKASGNIGLGLVSGFGLKAGALASSVAHDSHPIVVAGVNDQEMRHAVEEIVKMQGGFAAVQGGRVKASLPLPIAGLMSLESAETVASQMEKIKTAAKALGCRLTNPFLTLSFLALPVIPELKLTDKGLVDVSQFRIIPLEA